ncbi:MAG: CRISPR-associated endonuclease Cas2 [Deltaproteobacteria bacterium]|nr:CRISPR-associated endonuclease Cas2 [Deltaproteobacteria bacterium]
MMVLVSYDVSTIDRTGRRRLQHIAKHCLDYGQRVQYSVFECNVEPGQWETLKAKLMKVYKSDEDSLRFYYLGSNWKRRVEHFGIKPSISPDDAIII